MKAAKGAVGIVVSDKEGRCKEGQIAVRLHGAKRYLCLPLSAIEVVR